jgi:hypothetical protein
VRGLPLGGHVGTDWIIALGWRFGITAVGYMGAKRLYDRRPTR